MTITLQDVEHAARSARFRITSRKYDAANARMDHCAGAHHARLQRHVQRRIGKAVVAEATTGIAQRLDLGVGTGVVLADHAIAAFADDDVVKHDERPDRHFARVFRFARKHQRTRHPVAIAFFLGQRRRRNDHGISGDRKVTYSHSIVAGGLPLMS